MKKHRFRNASAMTQKFLQGEIRLILGESVDCEGGVERDGRYFRFENGESLHCKYVEGDRVAVMMSYKEAGLPAEQFAQSRGWNDRRYVSERYMPHTFTVEGVRCVRVKELTEEEMLKCGVYVNRGGNYMVGGSVGGWERSASAAFARMWNFEHKIPYERNPWVIVYDIVPLVTCLK